MDIKEKINKLTEVEAKAALLVAIKDLYGTVICGTSRCPKCKNQTEEECENALLDKALKEARK